MGRIKKVKGNFARALFQSHAEMVIFAAALISPGWQFLIFENRAEPNVMSSEEIRGLFLVVLHEGKLAEIIGRASFISPP